SVSSDVLVQLIESVATAVSELISIINSLWSTGVMLFLGGFLLTTIDSPFSLQDSGLYRPWSRGLKFPDVVSRQSLRMPDAVSGETSGNFKPQDHGLQPRNLLQDHHRKIENKCDVKRTVPNGICSLKVQLQITIAAWWAIT
ncbi:hypothetical protein L9F63_022924, partial [Diploptera punctata]